VLRTVHDTVWAFDLEWVPDTAAGRALYGLPDDADDRAVCAAMWQAAGATPENPHPYLKTALCRVASAALVQRRVKDGRVHVGLCSLPRRGDDPTDESTLLRTLFGALDTHQPQLVGFNSRGADLHLLVQRGVARGLHAPGLCRQEMRPYDGVNYFYRYGESHVDLMEVLGGHGSRAVSLREMAVLVGLPAKPRAGGSSVADLWLDGRYDEIVAYNECDAVTTYLLWLRTAHFAGCFTAEAYAREQRLVGEMLRREVERGKRHLDGYLSARVEEVAA
jgi:predicted PolB exonuclease-like 3'-5' exonuclease